MENQRRDDPVWTTPGCIKHGLGQRAVNADRFRQFLVRWIAKKKKKSLGTRNRGCVSLCHVELFKQPVYLRVGFHVDPGEEDPIFTQKVANPEGVR